MQVEEETGKQQSSIDYGDELDALLAEIVKPEIAPTSIDRKSSRSAERLPTLAASRGEIAQISYAPLEIGGKEMGNLDLDFSAGGEIAPFQAEYLPSSQELLRQIQAGAAESPSDSLGIYGTSTAAIVPKRQYLTKLQFGSVIGASMLAGAAVYVALNPSILTPSTIAKVSTSVAPNTVSNMGQSVQTPNLAANEFTAINLSTVGTIPAPVAVATPNVSVATDGVVNLTEVAPAAIPYNPTVAVIPPTTTVARKNLADSLVKSLLPPNFRSNVKPVQKRLDVGKKRS